MIALGDGCFEFSGHGGASASRGGLLLLVAYIQLVGFIVERSVAIPTSIPTGRAEYRATSYLHAWAHG